MKRNRDIISFFRDAKTVKPKSIEAETTQTQGGGGTEASIIRNELALVVASSIPSVNVPSQSQPQSQSGAQATGNDSDELCYDVELLPHDPSKRIPIMRYAINDQDAVRRGFILKGPCQPRQHDFPVREISGKRRRFNVSWFDKYNWIEYNVEKDVAFCFVCYLFKEKIVGDDSFAK